MTEPKDRSRAHLQQWFRLQLSSKLACLFYVQAWLCPPWSISHSAIDCKVAMWLFSASTLGTEGKGAYFRWLHFLKGWIWRLRVGWRQCLLWTKDNVQSINNSYIDWWIYRNKTALRELQNRLGQTCLQGHSKLRCGQVWLLHRKPWSSFNPG